MRALEDIRKANKRENPLLNKSDTPIFSLTSEEFLEGRKEFEEFIKPVSQKVFVRQLVK